MLICPICEVNYSSLETLINHIKVSHNFETKFSCKQGECTRVFQNVFGLKRHLKLKHKRHDDDLKQTLLSSESLNTENVFFDPNQQTVQDTSSNPSLDFKILYEKFKSALSREVALLVSKLYSNYALPRNVVRNVIRDFSEMLSKPLQTIHQLHAQNDGASYADNNINNIMNILMLFKDVFKDFTTEYMTIKYFRSENSFIEPITKYLGQTLSDKKTQSRIVAELTDSTCQYIPIRRTLQAFFEIPGILESVKAYLSSLNSSESVSNIVQSKLWKNITSRFQNKLVLPIYLYSDDFEIGNPLGSHKGIYKVCGIYFTLGCLPPEHSSLLENIFLIQLCYSSDTKYFGKEKVYRHIIEDLMKLETEGLTVSTETGVHHVYFSLALVLGDNLGIHFLLGLTESFTSRHYCRFCRCTKDETSTSISENIDMLRTRDNYETDLNTLSCGIKEACIWNSLPNFHFSENVSVDIMHDIWEGICRYDLGNVLYHFIYVDKLFTLENLNTRIQYFNFGNKNKPPAISKAQLLKKHIIFSASEMSTLIKNLSLIIGDRVPVNNFVWDIYLTLFEIICVVLSKVVTPGSAELLKTLISEHHSLYIQHFGSLKPKHHFLTHYPHVMSTIGPLTKVSSMRFEAKHKQHKATAKSVSSNINTLYTLALKNQLALSHRILAKSGFKTKLEFGSDDLEFVHSKDYAAFKAYLNCDISEEYVAVNRVKINGLQYSFGLVLVTDYVDLKPIFGVINAIIIKENDNFVYFVTSKLDTLLYDEHFHAYEVQPSNLLECIRWKDLHSITPLLIHIVQKRMFILYCD